MNIKYVSNWREGKDKRVSILSWYFLQNPSMKYKCNNYDLRIYKNSQEMKSFGKVKYMKKSVKKGKEREKEEVIHFLMLGGFRNVNQLSIIVLVSFWSIHLNVSLTHQLCDTFFSSFDHDMSLLFIQFFLQKLWNNAVFRQVSLSIT